MSRKDSVVDLVQCDFKLASENEEETVKLNRVMLELRYYNTITHGEKLNDTGCWNRDRFELDNSTKDTVCGICNDVMRHAMDFPCRHLFGRSCIEKHFNSGNNSCPTCHKEFTVAELQPNRQIQMKINELPISCSNRGCHETKSVSRIINHESTDCSFRHLKCLHCNNLVPYLGIGSHSEIFACICGVTIRACAISSHSHITCQRCQQSMSINSDLTKHANTCPRRSFACLHCETFVELADFPNHAKSVVCVSCNTPVYACLLAPGAAHSTFTCKNNCGDSTQFCPTTYAEHVKICPNVSLECPFVDYGCLYKAKRELMDVHTNDVKAHILLSSQKIRFLEREIENLRISKAPALGSIVNQNVTYMPFIGGMYSGSINTFYQPEGRGILTYDDGHYYDGEWKDGQSHGLGVHTWPNGRYRGEWRNNRPHGRGVYTSPNGDIEDGIWIDGSFKGNRTDMPFALENSSLSGKYTGNVNAMDLPHGRGTCIWETGQSYQGEWRNGKRHGFGVWKSIDIGGENTYEGDFQNDMFHGRGFYTWPIFRYYGEWKFNKQNGRGIQLYNDGLIEDGVFQDGIFIKPPSTTIDDIKRNLEKENSVIVSPNISSHRQRAKESSEGVKTPVFSDSGKRFGENRPASVEVRKRFSVPDIKFVTAKPPPKLPRDSVMVSKPSASTLKEVPNLQSKDKPLLTEIMKRIEESRVAEHHKREAEFKVKSPGTPVKGNSLQTLMQSIGNRENVRQNSNMNSRGSTMNINNIYNKLNLS